MPETAPLPAFAVLLPPLMALAGCAGPYGGTWEGSLTGDWEGTLHIEVQPGDGDDAEATVEATVNIYAFQGTVALPASGRISVGLDSADATTHAEGELFLSGALDDASGEGDGAWNLDWGDPDQGTWTVRRAD